MAFLKETLDRFPENPKLFFPVKTFLHGKLVEYVRDDQVNVELSSECFFSYVFCCLCCKLEEKGL